MEPMYLPSEMLNSKDLIAIYCNKQSTENFLVGQILTSDSEHLLLSLISPDSCVDGLCLCSAKIIFRIEQDSQYLRDMKKSLCSITTQHSESNPWDAILVYAEEHKFVTQIKGFSGKRIMFGIPVGHSKDMVAIHQVYSNGTQGKVLRINRDKIALLVCNSNTEQELQVVLQKRSDLNA